MKHFLLDTQWLIYSITCDWKGMYGNKLKCLLLKDHLCCNMHKYPSWTLMWKLLYFIMYRLIASATQTCLCSLHRQASLHADHCFFGMSEAWRFFLDRQQNSGRSCSTCRQWGKATWKASSVLRQCAHVLCSVCVCVEGKEIWPGHTQLPLQM